MQRYGQACDCWSIGVVAFVLLSGQMPFFEEDNVKLFDSIKACQYDFDDKAWDRVSKEAIDFIKACLVADPDKRLNCNQMLEH